MFLYRQPPIWIVFGITVFASTFGGSSRNDAAEKPNVILIFVDDLGYGDLGCYGSTRNRTPNIDRLAKEGTKFTDFYVAACVCTPSRAALMTGCYPRRLSLHQDDHNRAVLFPGSRKGLHPDEWTMAEMFKRQGYATACIGKWHLGDHPDFLPTKQGFDYYFGIPYSNDMNRKKIPLPLMRNETVIEAPAKQPPLTKKYTEETIRFIRENRSEPFFVYLPHTMVHLPLHSTEKFKGRSNNGKYGDALEEIDWSTGQILQALKELELDEKTLVIFTSDNGSNGANGGSNAPLRGRKGRTDEGGMRVPCLMRYPGSIPEGRTCTQLCTAMDLLPTFSEWCGGTLPSDRKIDGQSMLDLILGKPDAKTPRRSFYFYQMEQLQCIRYGDWKLHLPLESKRVPWGKPIGKTPLKLFNLREDIHEDHDVSKDHPERVQQMLKLAELARKDLGDGDQRGEHQRKAGWVEKASPRRIKQ